MQMFEQAGALRWYKSDVHAVSEREKRGCALPLHFAKVAAEGATEMRDGKVCHVDTTPACHVDTTPACHVDTTRAE